MHNKNIVKYCGQLVQQTWIARSITLVVIPSPIFCTHFVRNLWVSKRVFTRLVPVSFPRKNTRFFPVNQNLYSLPTGLTISTIFLNKNSFNNKNEVRSCV